MVLLDTKWNYSVTTLIVSLNLKSSLDVVLDNIGKSQQNVKQQQNTTLMAYFNLAGQSILGSREPEQTVVEFLYMDL